MKTIMMLTLALGLMFGATAFAAQSCCGGSCCCCDDGGCCPACNCCE